MKIRNIIGVGLWGVCVAQADFTAAEVANVLGEYRRADRALQERAQELLQPIRDQVAEQKAQLRVPFQTEIEPLQAQMNVFQQELDQLEKACEQLRRTLPDSRDRMHRIGRAAEEASAALRAELASRRAPVIPEIERLQRENQRVLNNYCHHKSQPYGRFMDDIDAQDCGFRMSAIETQIRNLYESVDGDLPVRIIQAEKAVRDRIEAEEQAQEESVNKSISAIKRAMQPIQFNMTELNEKINIIYGAQQRLIEEAMPDRGLLLGPLQEQIEMALIMEAPL